MPSLGESVTEATVAKWLKRPGEPVALDEPVVELETDKVTSKCRRPAAGTLAEILAEEGANLPVGAVLGRIGDARRNPSLHPIPPRPGPPSPAMRERGPSGARRVRAAALQRSSARAGGAQADRRERSRRRGGSRRPGPASASPKRM